MAAAAGSLNRLLVRACALAGPALAEEQALAKHTAA